MSSSQLVVKYAGAVLSCLSFLTMALTPEEPASRSKAVENCQEQMMNRSQIVAALMGEPGRMQPFEVNLIQLGATEGGHNMTSADMNGTVAGRARKQGIAAGDPSTRKGNQIQISNVTASRSDYRRHNRTATLEKVPATRALKEDVVQQSDHNEYVQTPALWSALAQQFQPSPSTGNTVFGRGSVLALAAQRARSAELVGVESQACEKYTGENCSISRACDESRHATCSDAGLCICPAYTCGNEGKCDWSLSEIGDAVRNGISNVVDQVTDIAKRVPGLADSVVALPGAAGAIVDTLGGIVGTLTGADMISCNSRYISTCFWYDCDPNLGYTVACVYGSCQCKEGFCAVDSKCIFDINAVLTRANASNASTEQ